MVVQEKPYTCLVFLLEFVTTTFLQYPSCTTMVRQGKNWLKRCQFFLCDIEVNRGQILEEKNDGCSEECQSLSLELSIHRYTYKSKKSKDISILMKHSSGLMPSDLMVSKEQQHVSLGKEHQNLGIHGDLERSRFNFDLRSRSRDAGNGHDPPLPAHASIGGPYIDCAITSISHSLPE